MKVILYMAMSVNGMIAKSDDDTSWVSKTEWESYSATISRAGCLIVGRRTYEILISQPEFVDSKDVKVVVVSDKNFSPSSPNHFVAHSPQEALKLLADFDEVVVAGGGRLNASFMAENLVDELYVDVEPIVLGHGIPLFHGPHFEMQVELVGQKMLSSSEIQLHYRVLRP